MMSEKSNEDIWLVLQKIKEERIKTPNEIIVYSVPLEPFEEKEKEVKILRDLNSWGAIKLLTKNFSPTVFNKTKPEKTEKYLIPFTIKPKFKEVFKFFQEKQTEESQNKIPNIYDFGFDRHLNLKEIVEENERAFQQREQNERDERERRERLKIQRVAASGKSPLIYAIDKIIDECLLKKDREKIEIHFHSLGFEDNMQELINARHLFDTLKNEGCFKTAQSTAHNWFVVTKPNMEKLEEYKNKLTIRQNDKIKKNKKISSKFIKEIICVKPKSGNKFIVILNNDYKNTIKGDRAKSWDLLFKVADEKENIYYEDSLHKSSLDYFNSNILNRIYTQTGYQKTKILKIEGGIITPNIKLSMITEKAFKTRLGKN